MLGRLEKNGLSFMAKRLSLWGDIVLGQEEAPLLSARTQGLPWTTVDHPTRKRYNIFSLYGNDRLGTSEPGS